MCPNCKDKPARSSNSRTASWCASAAGTRGRTPRSTARPAARRASRWARPSTTGRSRSDLTVPARAGSRLAGGLSIRDARRGSRRAARFRRRSSPPPARAAPRRRRRSRPGRAPAPYAPCARANAAPSASDTVPPARSSVAITGIPLRPQRRQHLVGGRLHRETRGVHRAETKSGAIPQLRERAQQRSQVVRLEARDAAKARRARTAGCARRSAGCSPPSARSVTGAAIAMPAQARVPSSGASSSAARGDARRKVAHPRGAGNRASVASSSRMPAAPVPAPDCSSGCSSAGPPKAA